MTLQISTTRSGTRLPERYVPGERGNSIEAKVEKAGILGSRRGGAEKLQGAHRSGYPFYSDLGEGGCGVGARARNNDWMEADCGDGGRKNWKEPADVCAGSSGRNHCDGDYWRSGRIGATSEYDHVLSSGVAGTMLANGSGLQWATVRNLLLAWVLTLPAAMTLSGFLFLGFRKLFHA